MEVTLYRDREGAVWESRTHEFPPINSGAKLLPADHPILISVHLVKQPSRGYHLRMEQRIYTSRSQGGDLPSSRGF
jgi:hypothetical protein